MNRVGLAQTSLLLQGLGQQQKSYVGRLHRHGTRVLAYRLRQVAILVGDQAQSDHCHWHGPLGRQLQRSFETPLRFHQISHLTIGRSEVAIGGGTQADIARVQSHDLIPFDRCGQIAAAMLVGAEIQVGGQIIRADGERGAEMRDRLFGSALAGEIFSQGVVGDVIVLGQRQVAFPE
jgi:hypothetical protein